MAVVSFFQFTRADGDINWPTGAKTFDHMWDRAYDLLRFHKGQKFFIRNHKTGAQGPDVPLKEIDLRLKAQLQANPDEAFRVQSNKDGFALIFRRHTEEITVLGEKFLNVGREFIGTPYSLGGSTYNGIDCSGLVIREADPFDLSVTLPHHAATMWQMFKANKNGMYTIDRKKILKGDLLIIHDGDHIATYIDDQDGGRVLDAEPSSVQSPWGWTPGGVQVRSMSGNYYCSWQNVNDVCRLSEINGKV